MNEMYKSAKAECARLKDDLRAANRRIELLEVGVQHNLEAAKVFRDGYNKVLSGKCGVYEKGGNCEVEELKNRIAAYDRALYRAGGGQYDCEMCVMRLPEHKDVDCIGKCEEYWKLDENLFIGGES